MHGILHHLFYIVYFLLWHTISNLLYFCILILCSSVYSRDCTFLPRRAPSFDKAIFASYQVCKQLRGDGGQSLMIEMLTYVSLLFNWAQFVKICMRPWFRVDCFLKTVHVHCVNPELCCTNLTSHWYAVIVKTTPKPKTFSSLLLQVNPRNWIQQNLTQSNPKRHYILMHRFWWISQTQGARREGFNAQCPSIPFDLN